MNNSLLLSLLRGWWIKVDKQGDCFWEYKVDYMLDGISIIICCYNSDWIIRRNLAALTQQQLRPEILWEVILVDNCCTDDTVAAAQAEMEGSKVNFRIVEERKAGLAYARRKGINEVQYRYVIYCDDDNLLCPTYVQTVYDMLAGNPRLGAVSGMGIAEFECEPDPRLYDRLGGYAVGSQAKNTIDLWGAGVGLRTEVVKEIYDTQKCYLIGRKGTKLLAGDDTELVYSVVLRGYTIKGMDEISYTHVLAARRLTWEYFSNMCKGFDLSQPILQTMRRVIHDVPFSEILKEQYYAYKALLYNIVYFKKPDAKENREQILKTLKNFNYWGIFTIARLYFDMKRIKKSHRSSLL